MSSYDGPVYEEFGHEQPAKDRRRYANILQILIPCPTSNHEQAISNDLNCNAGPKEGTRVKCAENVSCRSSERHDHLINEL